MYPTFLRFSLDPINSHRRWPLLPVRFVDKRYIKLNDTDIHYKCVLSFCFLNIDLWIIFPHLIVSSYWPIFPREGLGVVTVTRVRPSKMGVDTCTRQHIIRARAPSIVELRPEDGGSSDALKAARVHSPRKLTMHGHARKLSECNSDPRRRRRGAATYISGHFYPRHFHKLPGFTLCKRKSHDSDYDNWPQDMFALSFFNYFALI